MNTSLVFRFTAPSRQAFAFALAGCVLSFGSLPRARAAAPAADHVARIGLFDAEHTAADGFQQSAIWRLLENGVSAGTSTRFLGGSSLDPRGVSTWLADPSGATVQVGFDNAAHTGPSGEQESAFVDINVHGTAVGHTERPDGGRSAWIASLAAGTRRLGFVGGAYGPDGSGALPYSEVVDVNDEGWSVGFSRRQDGSQIAWMADPAGNLTRIGLSDAEHTLPDGRQVSTPVAINNAGYVVGTSLRYNASGDRETPTAWIRHTDGSYTTHEGQVLGAAVSHLTEGSIYAMQELAPSVSFLWLIDPAGNREGIGLTVGHSPEDSLFDRDTLLFLHENRTAAGNYSNYSLRAQTVFVHTEAFGSREVVLAGYRTGLGKDAFVVGVTPGGVTAGYSERGDSHGAWVGDPLGTATRIGRYDGVHLGAPAPLYGDHDHTSIAQGITDFGAAWGYSVRYHGNATAEGRTAWIFDTNSRELTSFEISVRPSDGYAFSEVRRVLENGIALGTYTKFDAAGVDLGERAFLWIPGQGTFDLGEILDVPPAAAGWEYLAALETGTLAGRLAGVGVPLGGNPASVGVFLAQLTGDVPPPAEPADEFAYLGRLGLYNARHTHASGYQSSELVDLADTGYTTGTSRLFVGADDVADRTAQSAWLGDPEGGTLRVGLYNARHTRDDGRQESTPIAVNDEGVVIGYSSRFDGHDFAGESAWVSDRHGNIVRVGFYGPLHMAGDGSTISRPVALNENNRLIGYSLNPETLHTSAWIARSVGQTTRIGLLDADHTAPDGTQVSLPVALNEAGHVAGVSEFHVPGVIAAGMTTWLYQPWGEVRRIGFQSGIHRAANGLHEGEVLFLSESGHVAGHATRYHANSNEVAGQTAWLTASDGPNRRIGFYTGLHAGAGNVAFSAVEFLNDAGFAAGYSAQFPWQADDPADARGRTAWIARPDGTTVSVGLYSALFTRDQHFQDNRVRCQGPDGSVAGTAEAFDGDGPSRGLQAWFARPTGFTTWIGLNDSRHRRADGFRRQIPTFVTGSGYVAGVATRFSFDDESGQTAWIHQRASGAYVRFDISVRESDDFSWSVITSLREDGVATGIYRKFAENGMSLGDHAFVYIPSLGMFDLGAALDVEPGDEGWAKLLTADFLNDADFIAGTGELLGYGPGAPPREFAQGVYLVRRKEPR